MKKLLMTVFLIIYCVLCSTLVCSAQADNNQAHDFYEYTYWGEVSQTPASYEVSKVMNLNLIDDKFDFPSDFVINNNEIVVVDNHANLITAISLDDQSKILWTINSFDNNGKRDTFNQPTSVIFNQGNIYVTDTENSRILEFDNNHNLVKVFGAPKINVGGVNYAYKPLKVAIDNAGYMYVIAKNMNQGLIVLDNKGEFQSFVGAPKVKVSFTDLMWRSISTKAQIERMAQFVPTEYNSLDMDSDGFIYCTSSSYNEADIVNSIVGHDTSDQFAMIKRLNNSGVDVLKRSGDFPPAGDIRIPASPFPNAPLLSSTATTSKDVITGQSAFTDVKSIDSGMYFCLDSNRNRIFCYDGDGNMLFTVGGSGNRASSMNSPVAIEYKNEQLYVLNSSNKSIQIYHPTEYGACLLETTRAYSNGEYDKANKNCQKLLHMNSNSEFANIMLGKICMKNSQYQQAMNYFRLANNKPLYSQALGFYCSQFLQRHFIGIVCIIILILAFIGVVRRLIVRYSKKESVGGQICGNICSSFYVLFHPFQGFYNLKYEKKGSLAIAFVLFGLVAVEAVLQRTALSFSFNQYNPKYVVVLFVGICSLATSLFFILSNWCFTTLMDGKGWLRDIVIFTAYAQLPIIIINLPLIFVSHFMTIDQIMLYNSCLMISTVWTLLLLFIGMLVTHDYTFGKSVIVLILTIFGIVVIAFLLLLLMNILGNITSFVSVFIKELSTR
jgi:hypothetical protein